MTAIYERQHQRYGSESAFRTNSAKEQPWSFQQSCISMKFWCSKLLASLTVHKFIRGLTCILWEFVAMMLDNFI